MVFQIVRCGDVATQWESFLVSKSKLHLRTKILLTFSLLPSCDFKGQAQCGVSVLFEI